MLSGDCGNARRSFVASSCPTSTLPLKSTFSRSSCQSEAVDLTFKRSDGIRTWQIVERCRGADGSYTASQLITWPEVAGILTSRSAKWAAASVAVPRHHCWRLTEFVHRGYVQGMSRVCQVCILERKGSSSHGLQNYTIATFCHFVICPLSKIWSTSSSILRTSCFHMLHQNLSGRLYKISWRAFMSPPTSPPSIWALEEHNSPWRWDSDLLRSCDIRRFGLGNF